MVEEQHSGSHSLYGNCNTNVIVLTFENSFLYDYRCKLCVGSNYLCDTPSGDISDSS